MGWKLMNKEKEFTTFFLAFMGQEIILTVNLIGSLVHDSDHGAITENLPIIYQGILLDEDSDNYYLGKTPNEITQFVPKNKVIHGKINDNDQDFVNEVLNSMPGPQNEEEIN